MKRYKNNSVLVMPDFHAPYHHPDTIPFLAAVAEKYQPDRVFQIGDWTDSYAFTRFPKDPEADSYTQEYKQVRKFTADLLKEFPTGVALKGNHDARLWDRAKQAGIPRGMILPYERVIGLEGTDWSMKYEVTFTVDANRQQYYLVHEKAGTVLNLAKALGCSVVYGHNHTKFEITSAMLLNKRVYGVHTGCLIGDNRYAFGYNSRSVVRPNRGCVMIVEGIPQLIPFDVGPKGKWNRVVR